MAEHFRDSSFQCHPQNDREDFAAESELLRGANTLPTLTRRLRERVLTAATSAYRQARRWAQIRQAASFLSICLLTSFALSPVANSSLTESAWEQLAQFSAPSFDVASPTQPNSVWTLRHDRKLLELPRLKTGAAFAKRSDDVPQLQRAENESARFVAHSELFAPNDNLLTTLRNSDGWDTVQAFQAVRSRSHSTLQRAFAAN